LQAEWQRNSQSRDESLVAEPADGNEQTAKRETPPATDDKEGDKGEEEDKEEEQQEPSSEDTNEWSDLAAQAMQRASTKLEQRSAAARQKKKRQEGMEVQMHLEKGTIQLRMVDKSKPQDQAAQIDLGQGVAGSTEELMQTAAEQVVAKLLPAFSKAFGQAVESTADDDSNEAQPAKSSSREGDANDVKVHVVKMDENGLVRMAMDQLQDQQGGNLESLLSALQGSVGGNWQGGSLESLVSALQGSGEGVGDADDTDGAGTSPATSEYTSGDSSEDASESDEADEDEVAL